MTYATQSDITTIYSTDALYVADREHDGEPDADVIDKALIFASAEIDGFLAVRYTLPLTGTHELLTQMCVDIALYRMASASDVMTDEHRVRYEDAMGHLKRLSKGEAKLVIPADPDDESGTADQGPSPIVSGGPEREFTRDKMRDL